MKLDKLSNHMLLKIYNTHMGYVDKSDRMASSYGIARKTWKWTKKLFLQLLDMMILNAFILHKSSGGKLTHMKFHETLVRDLITQCHELHVTTSGISPGRPSPAAAQLSRLQVKHSQHWPSKGKQRHCIVCSQNEKTRNTLYFCRRCDVGLCIVDCFQRWHTRVKL
jgi:hypothetical protein